LDEEEKNVRQKNLTNNPDLPFWSN